MRDFLSGSRRRRDISIRSRVCSRRRKIFYPRRPKRRPAALTVEAVGCACAKVSGCGQGVVGAAAAADQQSDRAGQYSDDLCDGMKNDADKKRPGQGDQDDVSDCSEKISRDAACFGRRAHCQAVRCLTKSRLSVRSVKDADGRLRPDFRQAVAVCDGAEPALHSPGGGRLGLMHGATALPGRRPCHRVQGRLSLSKMAMHLGAFQKPEHMQKIHVKTCHLVCADCASCASVSKKPMWFANHALVWLRSRWERGSRPNRRPGACGEQARRWRACVRRMPYGCGMTC
jgi:hypothetical protein